MTLHKFISSLIFHLNFSEESDDYDSDETVHPEGIDYYNDYDEHVPEVNDPGQDEVVQHVKILDIPSR